MMKLKNLLSRKFILTLLTDIVAIASLVSSYGGKVGQISSLIVIFASTSTYVITEGRIDLKTINSVIDELQNIAMSYDNPSSKSNSNTTDN